VIAFMATIQCVREAIIDGRPQIVIDFVDRDGRAFSFPLSREDARALTRAYGPHPLVEEFFRRGSGLQ